MDRKQFSHPPKDQKKRQRNDSVSPSNSHSPSPPPDACLRADKPSSPSPARLSSLRPEIALSRSGARIRRPSESELHFPIEDETEKDISIVGGGDFERVRNLTPNLMQILEKVDLNKSDNESDGQARDADGLKRAADSPPERDLADKEDLADSGKFIKIYEPGNFFEKMPEDKKVLLYPFLISKQYVDSVIRSKIFHKTGIPPLNSESASNANMRFQLQIESSPRERERCSDSANDLLSESQKCKKISKKLKRAWNLNQQIAQNVFKKVRLLYTSREESAFSSERDPSVLRREGSVFTGSLGQENQGDQSNVRLGKRPEINFGSKPMPKRKEIFKKVGLESEFSNPERNLRQSTRNKKKKENERLMRQKKSKKKKPKLSELAPEESLRVVRGSRRHRVPAQKDRGKMEVVEFLDYANKNIRKKKKENDKNEDEDMN